MTAPHKPCYLGNISARAYARRIKVSALSALLTLPLSFCLMPAMNDAALAYTHEDLARWRACPREFWLHRHGLVKAAMPAAQAQTDQVLKASFPQAAVIEPPTTEAQWQQAIERTQTLLTQGHLADKEATGHPDEGRAILGACLQSNEGVRVRIDVLASGRYGLRLFKVRFATVGNDADIDQVALWTHVAARHGLRIQSAGLLLVDTDFVYPGLACYAGLLRETELMPVLGSRPITDWLIGMRRCERDRLPDVPPDAPCHLPNGCDLTMACGTTHLMRRGDDVADLHIVGKELAGELREMGHVNVMSVPIDELPDERRRRAVRAVQQGRAILEPGVRALIAELPYPRTFLRIDTIGFAVPIWTGTRPYQVMPFQWTADIEHEPDRVTQHAFLATAQGDPRRAFAQSLLQMLGSAGTVFAYNAGFERNRLRELAEALPDLATPLAALQARIVDLYQLARAHYYHPGMCGSWSFKSLVRAVAPTSGADQFGWHGQHEAQEAFALSLQGRLQTAELDSLRQALLAYGQRQTLALRQMVALFESSESTP